MTLSNLGPTAVSFTAKSSTTWLSVSPFSGQCGRRWQPAGRRTINRAGLVPGAYSGTVTFTTPSGSVSAITITFTV